MTHFSGIVLCGGQSSRMGRPKAWLPFGGEFLLQRVVRCIESVADRVVVVAAPGQDLPPLPDGVRIVRDRREGCGPLHGFAAGLDALEASDEVVFLASCDCPFLNSEYVRTVVDLLGTHEIAIPIRDEFPQPLAAAYRTSLRPRVEQLVAAGRTRLLDLLDGSEVCRLAAEQFADLESLWNINTPDEYEAALRHLR